LNKNSAQNKNRLVTTASRKRLFHPKVDKTQIANKLQNPTKLPRAPGKSSRALCYLRPISKPELLFFKA
jgi:hypothetical protein